MGTELICLHYLALRVSEAVSGSMFVLLRRASLSLSRPLPFLSPPSPGRPFPSVQNHPIYYAPALLVKLSGRARLYPLCQRVAWPISSRA